MATLAIGATPDAPNACRRKAPQARDRREGAGARRALSLTVLEQARREMAAVPKGGAIEQARLVARLVLRVPPVRIPELRKRIYDEAHPSRFSSTP